MVVVIKKGSSKENMEAVIRKLYKKEGFPARKLCGTVKFKENPIVIQRNRRDEWNNTLVLYKP